MFVELNDRELQECDGGIGLTMMLLCAGGALIVGTGVGWCVGYFLGQFSLIHLEIAFPKC